MCQKWRQSGKVNTKIHRISGHFATIYCQFVRIQNLNYTHPFFTSLYLILGMPTLSIGQQLPASPIRKLVPYAEKAKPEEWKYFI